MCSSLLQLAPRSRDLSQAEKTAEQIEIKATVFTQDLTILGKNNCHFVNLLRLDSSYFLSA